MMMTERHFSRSRRRPGLGGFWSNIDWNAVATTTAKAATTVIKAKQEAKDKSNQQAYERAQAAQLTPWAPAKAGNANLNPWLIGGGALALGGLLFAMLRRSS